MQKFRNLSNFDEGGIERLHHWWKVKARLLNPIRLWASQVKAILKRKTVETTLGVGGSIQKMWDATRRVMGPAVQKRHDELYNKL